MTKPILWTSTRTSGTIVHQMVAASGLDLDIRFISLRKGDHKTPDFLAINPKGEVAAIQIPDAGVTITEIPAMALWLAEAAPDSGLLPRDAIGRAKGMEWLCWCHFRMANTFSLAFQAKRLTGGDEAAAAALKATAVTRAQDALAFADAQLAGRPHGTILGTEKVSAADIFLAALLGFGGFLGVATDGYANLKALGAKVAAVPAIAAALAREQEIG
ncbi:glutathione S-transferase family protein [Neoroseomonas oryzicola]|uniref:Glutathione S-transferase family protein n=1 Tax=Neoroseomonas oryzicola TaxID=535904 RepID=A0A9X9WLL1_9PROT|nr:glutathione S-transferase family protein [Neoroseomonas oryzicola]MBR0661221.1 glutathione S-transferase family protein [Neoroseomonas oryzicola]NKE19560.1 glutathione S-transferase family protein [Neoroseomonas oryzicola]